MPQDVNTDSAAFIEQLAACDFNDREERWNLISNRHSRQMYEAELEKQFFTDDGSLDQAQPFSAFLGFFGSRPHNFGEGYWSSKTETYHAPMLQPSLGRWKKIVKPTDPNDPSLCDACYETLPSGGYSTQDIELFDHHVRTLPQCIDGLKGTRDFLLWMDMTLSDQLAFDQFFPAEFSLFSTIRTAGNKILLETDHPSSNAQGAGSVRDILHDFPMTYRQYKFPAPSNKDNIVPFDLRTGEYLHHQMVQRGMTKGKIGTTSYGSPVFSLWTSDDWYNINVLNDPDYREKMKYTMPEALFRGYTTNNVEVYKGLSPKVTQWMPRFADLPDGGIGIVPFHTNVGVEIGVEAVASQDYLQAPYEIIMLVSPNQMEFLDPQPITTNQRIPVRSVLSNSGWVPMNPYDKECNPKQNKPWWEKDYHMGIAPKRPDESVLLLARRKRFRYSPANNCDVYDRRTITPYSSECVTEDCAPRRDNQESITSLSPIGTDTVPAISNVVACGDDTLVWVNLEFMSKLGDFNHVACGSTVELELSDGDTVEATIVDSQMNPGSLLLLQLAEALDPGVCVVNVLFDASVSGSVSA